MEKMQKMIQNGVMPVLLLLTTVISIFNTTQTNKLDLKSKEIKNTIDSLAIVDKQREISREDIEFNRKLKFQLFEEVKLAIKDNDPRLQKTVYEFVTQMVADDEAFRNALLKSLENSQNVSEEVREKITENFRNQQLFKAQEVTAQVSEVQALTQNSRVRVDIFYLEENEAKSKPLAESIREKVKAANKYDVRLRVLPKLTNAQKGYLVYTNEIRFEDSEKEIANELSGIINPLLREPITLKPIGYKGKSKGTENYVSVFLRNE